MCRFVRATCGAALERDLPARRQPRGTSTGLVGADKCSKARCDLSRGVVDRRQGRHRHDASPGARPGVPLQAHACPPLAPFRRHADEAGRAPRRSGNRAVHDREPRARSRSCSPATRTSTNGRRRRSRTATRTASSGTSSGTPGQQLTAVEQGKADYDPLTELPWRDELATRYSAQVHIFPTPSTYALFLNTRVAPFDNLKARQAVNYAIDRRQVAAGFGTEGAVVTCQILPVGFARLSSAVSLHEAAGPRLVGARPGARPQACGELGDAR